MTTAVLQKKADILERLTQQTRRALMEFKIAKSKWEIENGKYKVYSSAKSAMRDVKKLIS